MSSPLYEYHLVSPEKKISQGQSAMVVIPAMNGDMGLLYGHSPMVTLLRPGVVQIITSEEDKSLLFVPGGLAHIESSQVTLMIEKCLPFEQIDLGDLEQKILELKEELTIARTAFEKQSLESQRQLLVVQKELYQKLIRP